MKYFTWYDEDPVPKMKLVGKLVRLSEETSRIGESAFVYGSVVKRFKRVRIKKALSNAIFMR